MHLTSYSWFFIYAGIVLLLLKILNLVSRKKRFRYIRYFKSQKDVRFQKISLLAKYPETIPDDLSPQEWAGILILISGRHSVSQSFSTAIQLSDSKSINLLNEDFFHSLFTTAKRFQNFVWIKESLEIMNLGKMIANHVQNSHWETEFQEQIQTLRYYRSGNATTYASDKVNLRKF